MTIKYPSSTDPVHSKTRTMDNAMQGNMGEFDKWPALGPTIAVKSSKEDCK